MDNKTIKVIFEDGLYECSGINLNQGDYGQVLKIEGLSLPDGNVEVHFSLTEHNGEAPISIGTVKDKVITVDIPDFILQKKDVYTDSYQAYAWIYVTDGESGRTIRKIVFTIDTRAEATTNVPEDQKDKFLQEVRQVMAETKEVAQSVRDDADNGKFSGIPGPPGKDGENGKDGDDGEDGKSAYQYAVEGGFEGTEQEFIDLMAQAGQVDLTGYVSKEQHEAELLKAMVKVTTDKAPFHHITDSANMKVVDFGMEGITEQKTTPGNQLFDVDRAKNPDNWKLGVYNYLPLNLPAGDYTLSFSKNVISKENQVVMDNTIAVYISPTAGSPANSKCTIGSYNIVSGVNRLVYNFTINEGEELYLNIFTNSSGNNKKISQEVLSLIFDELSLDTMINEGSTALPYEPYTGGQLSPNPDYKQEIKNAGVYNEETGRYEHKCCVGNKNWFDLKSENVIAENTHVRNNVVTDIENGIEIAFTNTRNSFVELNIRFFPFTTYTISCNAYIEADKVVDRVMRVINVADVTSKWYSGNIASVTYKEGKNTVTFTTGDNTENIKAYLAAWSMSDGATGKTTITDFQIEVNTSATEPIPHASQPFTLTSDRPLTMWDNLVKVDGKWYWDYKQLKLVVDGTKQWYVYGSGKDGGFRMIGLDFTGTRRDGYCNQLVVSTHTAATQTNMLWIGINNNNLYALRSSFYDDTLEDKGIANWKAHLNEHPLEIYTYKDESELVPLLDEEQTILNNLETYYGVTNVYNEQGCPMWLEYVTDTKLYVDQKLLEIQQAII